MPTGRWVTAALITLVCLLAAAVVYMPKKRTQSVAVWQLAEAEADAQLQSQEAGAPLPHQHASQDSPIARAPDQPAPASPPVANPEPKPQPVTPAPVQAEPEAPAPVAPAPVAPAPVTPAPEQAEPEAPAPKVRAPSTVDKAQLERRVVCGGAKVSRKEFGNRLSSWREELNAQYKLDFPAAAQDREVARQLTINMSKIEVPNKPTVAVEYNHFEECYIPNFKLVADIIRPCRQFSRWCDAYPVEEAFDRYVAPSVYGSARRWTNNFRAGHLIHNVVSDECQRAKAFSVCTGLACQKDKNVACMDKDVPRLQPINRDLARGAILCRQAEARMEPGLLPMTHATAFDVCVRNGTLFVARGLHMCGWGPGQLQGAGPKTEQADEVLHINPQYVNFGEFAHFVQQLLLPMLPYLDVLKDNPEMRLSFMGMWNGNDPGKRFENLVQYIEALGVNRTRLIQAPYQAKRVYVARFVDSGVDQGLLWPARAAAWEALNLLDAPERIVCPGARTATKYSDFSPCVYASQAPEEAAQRYAGAPEGVPDSLYIPMVDVPILLQQRTGRRSITNFDELLNAMQAGIAEWQQLPELSRIRLTLLMHTDTDDHNTDKALIMKMVAQSRIFVGNHGAGMSLAPLMRPNSAVVEVLSHDPPNYRFSGAVFMISSGRSGLQHHAVMTDEIFPMNDAYVINVQRVMNATRNGLRHVVEAENMEAALRF